MLYTSISDARKRGSRVLESSVERYLRERIEGLGGRDLGEELLLPRVMLREGEEVFLDDTTLADLRDRLPVPVRLLGGADDLVAACLGTPRGDA
jgi:NifB/MoaA-like Fe-S oxidoreductase